MLLLLHSSHTAEEEVTHWLRLWSKKKCYFSYYYSDERFAGVFIKTSWTRLFVKIFLKILMIFLKVELGAGWDALWNFEKNNTLFSFAFKNSQKQTIKFFHCLPKKKHLNKWLDRPIFSKQTILLQKRMWNLSPNFNLLFSNFSK